MALDNNTKTLTPMCMAEVVKNINKSEEKSDVKK